MDRWGKGTRSRALRARPSGHRRVGTTRLPRAEERVTGVAPETGSSDARDELLKELRNRFAVRTFLTQEINGTAQVTVARPGRQGPLVTEDEGQLSTDGGHEV